MKNSYSVKSKPLTLYIEIYKKKLAYFLKSSIKKGGGGF